jgi:hypothetical protein
MKVIFMSVFADEGVIHHGLAGAAFLPKPFTPGDVMRNVCRILAEKPVDGPAFQRTVPGKHGAGIAEACLQRVLDALPFFVGLLAYAPDRLTLVVDQRQWEAPGTPIVTP